MVLGFRLVRPSPNIVYLLDVSLNRVFSISEEVLLQVESELNIFNVDNMETDIIKTNIKHNLVS